MSSTSRPASIPTASQTLCEFVHRLEIKDIPTDVIERAKHCMVDTLGVSAFGAQFPWSQAVLRFAKAYGQSGGGSAQEGQTQARSQLMGVAHTRLQAPQAALVNGAFAHAFEMDSLRKPGAGVHPGATLLPAALALAQEVGASGPTALRSHQAWCSDSTPKRSPMPWESLALCRVVCSLSPNQNKVPRSSDCIWVAQGRVV